MAGINKLTDNQIKAAIKSAAKSGKIQKLQDGGNLYLAARPTGTASFVYQYSYNGKRPEMGLGPYPTVSLATAREQRNKWQAVRAIGKDPIREREKERREATVENNSLSVVTQTAYRALQAGWKHGGKNWLSPLDLHILPKLGHLPVSDISANDIAKTLAPIWNAKHETAKQALTRLGMVIKHAAARGENVDITATDRAKILLGKTTHKTKHYGTLHWKDVPSLYQSIPEDQLKYLALKFIILVPSVRSAPVRNLRLSDLADGVWTVPAEELKSKLDAAQDYKIILSQEALRIVALARPYAKNDYLFASRNHGPMGSPTMRRALQEFSPTATPHGLRSSLLTFLEEAVTVPANVKKSLLAHTTGNAVEQSYNRSEYIDARKVWLERWAMHCLSNTGEVVVSIRKAK